MEGKPVGEEEAGKAGRVEALWLRNRLWSQILSLLPVPPGARGLTSPNPHSLSEIMLDES